MADNLTPVHALNHYTQGLISQKLGWADIDGHPPIAAASDQPEFTQSFLPHMVYGWSSGASDYDSFFMSDDLVSYNILSPSWGDVDRAVMTLKKAFERLDASAEDINVYIAADPRFDGIFFKYTQVAIIDPIAPPDDEGGYYEGHIVIRYCYAEDFPDGEFRLTV